MKELANSPLFRERLGAIFKLIQQVGGVSVILGQLWSPQLDSGFVAVARVGPRAEHTRELVYSSMVSD